MIECATECLEKSAFCEGFIFSGDTKLCKLVGSLGTISSNCDGEYYQVIQTDIYFQAVEPSPYNNKP